MERLLMTVKAAGVHLGDYVKYVLLRISEPDTVVTDLTPHGWKERFEPEVTARRHEIRRKLVGAPTAIHDSLHLHCPYTIPPVLQTPFED